jgi:amino acid transporter
MGDMAKLAFHTPGMLNATTHQGFVNFLTVVIAVGITLYFWRLNIIGIHESSDKALRIMQLTTIMGVLIVAWSAFTLFRNPNLLHVPPLHPVFTGDSLDPGKPPSSAGWLVAVPKLVGAIGILVAFGHSLLAMSGEESLAQVNREIEAPKLKNLLRAGFVIFLYSMLLTSLISFLAVLIIPDGKRVTTLVVDNGVNTAQADAGHGWVEVDYLRRRDAAHPEGDWGYLLERETTDVGAQPLVKTGRVVVVHSGRQHVERDNGEYRDNLINGLVHYLAGPSWLKIIMECFVVVVGFLILAGAVNTSLIGSNGVLNRLAEDGVLTPWFQHPQKRYGTTYRLIHIIGVMQVVVIIASLGDVDTLGEAYAFGVIWSFVFMTFSMAVLRFKDRSPRAYRVPFNLDVKLASGAYDVPIGIGVVFLILATTAIINLATKKTATIWGVGFTAAFMIVFTVVERISHRHRGGVHHDHMEQFNEAAADIISPGALRLTHPDPVLVAVRNPGSLRTLNRVLRETDTAKQDVVVVTCKVLPRMTAGVTPEEQGIQDADRSVLTRVVTVAEEAGKRVHPLVVPTNNPLYAIATAARDLKAGSVVLGESEKVGSDELAEQFAIAWGMAMGDAVGDQPLTLRIIGEGRDSHFAL